MPVLHRTDRRTAAAQYCGGQKVWAKACGQIGSLTQRDLVHLLVCRQIWQRLHMFYDVPQLNLVIFTSHGWDRRQTLCDSLNGYLQLVAYPCRYNPLLVMALKDTRHCFVDVYHHQVHDVHQGFGVIVGTQNPTAAAHRS
jgi:hypothetical protein